MAKTRSPGNGKGAETPTVHFVAVDLDAPLSPEHRKLANQCYKRYIPRVLVSDGNGKPLYTQSGEVDSAPIEATFKNALHP